MGSLKWLKEMKRIEEEINQKLEFLSGFNAAFRDQIHTDILIKPGNDTPCIPAHRALLATSGDLARDKLDKHLYSLTIAADKYEITFLQKFCENRMLEILNTSNALDILEIADTTCNRNLKETALSYVVKNMEDVVFAPRFDVFALKNPHLTVQITRASFLEIKNRRSDI
nr:hypothetical protein [Tanacetum cinerariifolium]